MKNAAQILRSKSEAATFSVTPETSVFDAVKLLAEKNIGALLVMEGEKIAGMFTERDYARKIALMGLSSRTTSVREIMIRNVICVRPDQSIEECMALMTDKRIRHLPVMEDGKLMGVLSIGDLVKEIISEQKFTIQQLEHYIAGG